MGLPKNNKLDLRVMNAKFCDVVEPPSGDDEVIKL